MVFDILVSLTIWKSAAHCQTDKAISMGCNLKQYKEIP
jgi:hypothetical protein